MSPNALLLLLKGLDLLVLGIQAAPAVRRAFGDITLSVRGMVEEGRDPTPEEWAQLDKLRDTIHHQIQRDPQEVYSP